MALCFVFAGPPTQTTVLFLQPMIWILFVLACSASSCNVHIAMKCSVKLLRWYCLQSVLGRGEQGVICVPNDYVPTHSNVCGQRLHFVKYLSLSGKLDQTQQSPS